MPNVQEPKGRSSHTHACGTTFFPFRASEVLISYWTDLPSNYKEAAVILARAIETPMPRTPVRFYGAHTGKQPLDSISN
jgi:hypothetical protein